MFFLFDAKGNMTATETAEQPDINNPGKMESVQSTIEISASQLHKQINEFSQKMSKAELKQAQSIMSANH